MLVAVDLASLGAVYIWLRWKQAGSGGSRFVVSGGSGFTDSSGSGFTDSSGSVGLLGASR
jgi:hypothetical protein